MKDVISREDMLKALGESTAKESAESSPTLTLTGVAETVTHNANVTQRVISDLATEITMTNLVVKHVMRKLEIDPQEVVDAATNEFNSLSQVTGGGDLPREATVFGG